MNLVARPATAAEIAEAERSLGASLPDSFRWFQLEFGDFQHGPVDIYSVRTPEPPAINIVGINHEARTEEGPRLPAHLIAFSDNDGGDYLCFDTTRREASEYPVVWWDHDQDEDQQVQAAAPSFLDWLESELKEQAAEDRPSLRGSWHNRSSRVTECASRDRVRRDMLGPSRTRGLPRSRSARCENRRPSTSRA